MTRDGVIGWLAGRTPAPPAGLGARVRGAVSDTDAPLPERLVQLGRDLLGRVAARPAGGRELALDLLAADALITYAFEAQAETDIAGLARLAERAAGGLGEGEGEGEPCSG